MKIEKGIKKILVFALLFCVFLGNFNFAVSADSRKGSIKLIYLKDADVVDVRFDLYKVADFDGKKFIPYGDFKRYKNTFNFNPNSASGWNNLAYTMESYIYRDGLSPNNSAYTNYNYELSFTNLNKGLYLVVSEDIENDDYIYQSDPFFIVLPRVENGISNYNIVARPKYTVKKKEDEEYFLRRKALKVWENDFEESRPDAIEVELLRNGKLYDTRALNAKNSWKVEWTDLSSKYTWTVVEKDIAQGYNVTIERNGMTFVITNSGNDTDIPDDDTPKDKKNPPKPDTPEDETIPEPDVPLARIPKTGVLWWPVPVLLASGILMFIFSFIKRKRS